MNFVISSKELEHHLQAIGKVINAKNTLPILDNFLFELKGNELTIKASDLETTMITKIILENASGKGLLAMPAKILLNSLKEFPEQPLTFNIDDETLAIDILSENGKFSVVGLNGEDYPQASVIKSDEATKIQISSEILFQGITKTIFATAHDELRPVMNGIFIELTTETLTFVASDSHKLVRYRRSDIAAEKDASFILPQKPAGLLKNILPKEGSPVNVEFDNKNAYFELGTFKVICRLVEGVYPNYDSVIPVDNPNKLTIDRVELYNTLRRVSVFSNQASNLVKLSIVGNQLTISARDIDFSISAYEKINCQYEGEEIEIGFKSLFLIEILQNISSVDVILELSDP
ncbi:MAG: DNA polymerase III subunit beta, partial [Bacteroidota bacterium]